MLVHLGTGNYLQRYKIYVTHVQAWRQQFTKLDSVDLRYDGQIIVNPDLEGMPRQPALTQAAARAAFAAGVKNAAIVNYEKFVTHPTPPTIGPKQAETKSKAAGKPEAKPQSKAAPTTGSKPVPKPTVHRTSTKPKTKAKAKGKGSAASHASARPVSTKPTTTSKVQPDSGNTSTKATANSQTAAKAAKPAPPTASPVVASGQKKPSAGIPKENPQN